MIEADNENICASCGRKLVSGSIANDRHRCPRYPLPVNGRSYGERLEEGFRMMGYEESTDDDG